MSNKALGPKGAKVHVLGQSQFATRQAAGSSPPCSPSERPFKPREHPAPAHEQARPELPPRTPSGGSRSASSSSSAPTRSCPGATPPRTPGCDPSVNDLPADRRRPLLLRHGAHLPVVVGASGLRGQKNSLRRAVRHSQLAPPTLAPRIEAVRPGRSPGSKADPPPNATEADQIADRQRPATRALRPSRTASATERQPNVSR